MSNKEGSALLVKTAKAAEQGKYEPYKTTDTYDATTHNPTWMG